MEDGGLRARERRVHLRRFQTSYPDLRIHRHHGCRPPHAYRRGGQGSTVSDSYDADQFLATQIRLIQSDSVLRPVVQRYHLREPEKQGQDGSPERAIRMQRTPVSLALKVTRPPNTYLLLISYRSADPDMAANVVNAVATSYLQRTFEIRYRATADLSTFMEKQIEELRAKMERSGLALAQFERELNVITRRKKRACSPRGCCS